MSEAVQGITTAPRGTVGYERKINSEARGGNKYEHEQASIFVQFDINPEDDHATVVAARDAFQVAKAVVFEQLSIQAEIVDGVVVEKAAKASQQISEAQVAAAFSGNQAQPTAASGGGVPRCPECNSDMYDNRATKKGNQPDFKCKRYASPPKGTGCKGAVWE